MIKLLVNIIIRRFLSDDIDNQATNVYSLEVSMFGYKPDKKSDKIQPYTEENCRMRFTNILRLRC